MMKMYKLIGALALTAVLGSEIQAQTSYTWTPAGPVLSAGRSRNMVVDRNDNNVLYVGSVSSGVFKSTDAGGHWSPLDDQGDVRNVSYMAQDANGVIYAATGEGFSWFQTTPGTGVYKLSGTSLVPFVNETVTGTTITRIACHPSDANKMAVAGSNGLQLTMNGGGSWTQGVLPIGPTATALTVAYDNAGAIYVTATTDPNGGGVKVYKSADGSATGFVDITPPQASLPSSNYGRIELGISNSNNAVIYASIAKPTTPFFKRPGSASLYGFFVSKDGGASWTMILEGSPQLDPLSNGSGYNTGDYAHCVVVHPFNPDIVFVSGFRLYVWAKTTGGPEGVGNWYNQFFGQPNIHDMKITANGSNVNAYYFVTDAGVYKSTDNLMSYQLFSNGLGTAQFNSISIARYPKASKTNNTLDPYSSFLAGSSSNGVTNYSGNYPLVTKEFTYFGSYYNVEFSKLSPNTAFFAAGGSNIYVATDVTNQSVDAIPMQVSHLGTQCLSSTNITSLDFRGITSNGATTDEVYANNKLVSNATPFKLWETHGNIAPIDSAIFFNDSIRVLIPVTTTVGSTYTVSLVKPQLSAIIDKVNISTFTVSIPTSTAASCFANSALSYTQNQKATMEFDGATSPTTMPTSYTLTGLTSTVMNTNNKLTILTNSLSPSENKDVIQFELPANPLLSMTGSTLALSQNYQYVRVGVTIFYRYKAGSKIKVENLNISNIPFKDSTVLASDLQWTFNNSGTNSLTPIGTGAPIKYRMPVNSRFALVNDKGVLVSKRALNTNDPQKFQVVSCTGALTTNSSTYTAGQMTVSGTPYLLEWAPNGKAIYYVTSNTTTSTYNVYKVNVGTSMYDFSIEDYRGAYYTGCVTSKRGNVNTFTYTTNFNSRYRTTLIGSFSEQITNLAVSDNNKTLLLTTYYPVGTSKRIYVSTPNIDLDNVDNTVVTFSDKTSNLPAIGVYCALFEMSDNKRVLVGTDKGIYATDDITAASPVWFDAKNNKLPNVQVLDIKQQKMSSWDSYNSGIIYVATNGRGAWSNKNFLTQTVIGIEEHEITAKNTGLSLYPNPTNGNVTLNFFAADNENVVVNVMDINGRIVKSEAINKLNSGYTDYNFNTSELSNGVYIVNVTSSVGIKRVSKLIVSK